MAAVIGVATSYVESLAFHGVYEKYIDTLMQTTECTPVLLPCIARLCSDLTSREAALLERLDGILLPGSLSNVHPSRYGEQVTEGVTHFDEGRDETILRLVRLAVAGRVPVFGICRGMQELNCAFGGTLHQAVHGLEGHLDHRAPQGVPQASKYGPAHPISIASGGRLQQLLASAGTDTETVEVNSLHGQAVNRLGDGLVAEAWASDGIVEAISMPGAEAFTFGVQWHPEWHTLDQPINRVLFASFADACLRRAAARRARCEV